MEFLEALSGITLSGLELGNWHKAQEYCNKINSHLVSLTPALAHELRLWFATDYKLLTGWNKTHGRIFAGLHRNDKV